jgi:predicted NBD/HSP70 family sugar kinase
MISTATTQTKISHRVRRQVGRQLVGRAAEVFRLMRDQPQVSQMEIAERLGISVAACNLHFQSLQANHWIEPGEMRSRVAGAGRPSRGWRVAKNRNFVIGMATIGSELRVALMDFGDRILVEKQLDLNRCREQRDLLDWLGPVITSLVAKAHTRGGDVRSFCAALAGDLADNVVAFSSSLPILNGLALDAWSQRQLGMRCHIAPLMYPFHLGLPESFRASDQTILAVCWDLGVGLTLSRGEVLLNGPDTGFGQLAGLWEFGHTPAVPDGNACPCGRRGCLETYVGGRSLITQLAGAEIQDLADLIRRAQRGDAPVLGLLRDAAERLGRHLGRALVLIAPQRMVFTGPLATLYPSLAPSLEQGLRECLTVAQIESLGIATFPEADELLVIGACRMAQRLSHEPDV